jgi:hypothetical protein
MTKQYLEKFELNYGGIRQLLHSKEMQSALMQGANQLASNAGDGYKAVQMPTRVIVVPETEEAERDNLKNNTLLKSRR